MSESAKYKCFVPAETSAGRIKDVVALHAAEAAFHWQLRDHSVCAPHSALKEVAKFDERVEAHLHGLRVAADAGQQLCLKALEEGTAA